MVSGARALERIGKYEIVAPLRKGGMGELFVARAAAMTGLEKLVVIKRVLPRLGSSQEFVQMFLDEVRIAATLEHANVVRVYDVGVEDGPPYLVMELLHGVDVGRLVDKLAKLGRPLTIDHAITIVLGVCAGLHYAHEKTTLDGRPLEIVHRDVSPKNVMVTFDGGVKLLDFGIARARNRETETRKGFLKGTVRYMSPEQCQALRVDRRSDIFSAAILLWELTTGTRLYSGESDFEVARMIVEKDAPAPSTVVPGYPPELERIVMMGLARVPGERFRDAQAFQAALEAYAREARLAISPIALGRLLADTFPDRVQQGEHFRKLAERTSSGDVTETPSSGPIAVAARHNADTVERAESPVGATTVLDGPRPITSRRPRWGRRALLLLVAAALMTTLLVTWKLRRSPDPASAPAPAPVPVPAAVPAAAAAAVPDAAPVADPDPDGSRVPTGFAGHPGPGPGPVPPRPKHPKPRKPPPDKKPLDPDAPLWE